MKYSLNYEPARTPSILYVDGVIEPKEGLVIKSQLVVAFDKTTLKPVAYANTGEQGQFYFRLANLNLLTVLCLDRTGTFSATLVDNVTPAVQTNSN